MHKTVQTKYEERPELTPPNTPEYHSHLSSAQFVPVDLLPRHLVNLTSRRTKVEFNNYWKQEAS